MKVWTNTEFGQYQAGSAALVVASTPAHAAELLNDALVQRGLEPRATKDQFQQVHTRAARAIVLGVY